MNRNDMTAKSDCAARSGGAIVARVMLRIVMRRSPDAIVRDLHVID